MFNFLRLLPIGDNTKCRSPNRGKNWGLSPTEGDKINRSRRNLAGKSTPSVGYSTPNLAFIGKRVSVIYARHPICPKLCFFWPPEADAMNTFRRHLACKCRPWVCSSAPNLALIRKSGSVQEPPKVKICQKLWIFGHREPP